MRFLSRRTEWIDVRKPLGIKSVFFLNIDTLKRGLGVAELKKIASPLRPE